MLLILLDQTRHIVQITRTRITNVGAYQQLCGPSSRPTVYLQNFSYTFLLFSWNRTLCRKVTPKNYLLPLEMQSLPSPNPFSFSHKSRLCLPTVFSLKSSKNHPSYEAASGLNMLGRGSKGNPSQARAKGCWEITLAIASIDLPYTLGYTMRLFYRIVQSARIQKSQADG